MRVENARANDRKYTNHSTVVLNGRTVMIGVRIKYYNNERFEFRISGDESFGYGVRFNLIEVVCRKCIQIDLT